MATRIAVHERGPDPADRHAERDLPPAELALRRRLHRRVELPRGRRPPRPAWRRLADGRAVPCSANGRPSSAAATLMMRPGVDPRRRPGRRAGGVAARTDRSDVVPREPDPGRRQAATRSTSPLTASQFGRERIAARDLAPDREVALWWEQDDAVLLPEDPTTMRRNSDVTITDRTLSRADLLKAGAAGALGLYLAGPAFGRSVQARGHHAELADLVGPLRERPAQGREQGRRRSRAGRRCSPTTPTPT